MNTELSSVPKSGTKSFPSYSKSELMQMQQSDPTISSLLKFWRVGRKPDPKEKKDLTIGTRACLVTAMETVGTEGPNLDAAGQVCTHYTDVEKCIKSCERCVLSKMPQSRIRTSMGYLLTEQPLSVFAIDFTLLERSSDITENVFVMTDVFTKFALAVPAEDKKASTLPRCWSKSGFKSTAHLNGLKYRNAYSADDAEIFKYYLTSRARCTN
ncbi:Transposon Ty3-I Gag-Pol poly [Paramuricea clavata]|uniref:Transposon Ty3-I Gag-Pol poly n=1 Tax=Paramuricea clavata TaxID=317549 RepID=A0A6S7HID4_PARCT|nr:Transposon Ty3-I Gag-Pol poly [Paramuricea clavata]